MEYKITASLEFVMYTDLLYKFKQIYYLLKILKQEMLLK